MGSVSRQDVVQRFAWVEGHADVWRWFHDGPFLSALGTALADPFRDDHVTKVAGIEARGFILGALVAVELRVGFLPIRKSSGLFPGPKYTHDTPPDYRRNTTALRVQTGSSHSGDRVILVDDWIETGSQAATARKLIEATGATFLGASVIVDQLTDAARSQLGRRPCTHPIRGPSNRRGGNEVISLLVLAPKPLPGIKSLVERVVEEPLRHTQPGQA